MARITYPRQPYKLDKQQLYAIMDKEEKALSNKIYKIVHSEKFEPVISSGTDVIKTFVNNTVQNTYIKTKMEVDDIQHTTKDYNDIIKESEKLPNNISLIKLNKYKIKE